SVTRPKCARLKRRNRVIGEAQGSPQRFQIAAADTLHAPAEEAAVGDQRHLHLVAITLAQGASQVADGIDKTKFQAPPTGPILPRKQGGFAAVELVAASAPHQ